MALSIKYWEKRCDRLFGQADAMGDTFDADLSVFQKQQRLYREASLISMMLDSFEAAMQNYAILIVLASSICVGVGIVIGVLYF